MSIEEKRQTGRGSLFIMAELRLDGDLVDHRVRTRNLSAGGMMAEGPVPVTRGTDVRVFLRNIGWIDGTVAWVQGNRFGIAFLDEIDPGLVLPADGTAPDDTITLKQQLG